MISHYWDTFLVLLAVPFQRAPLIWGIVPLYFALLFNEMTSSKANFHTAIQTGFSLLWSATHWLYPTIKFHLLLHPHLGMTPMPALNLVVTVLVIAFGLLALVSGLLRHFPKHCSFLGHTRFSSYFMITIFPIQAGDLVWTWDRLIAIALFAVPIWLVLHFGLMPLRK